MKKIQLTLAVLAGALAIGLSAFTSPKSVNSHFYIYTSSSHLQADIQNINNYVSATDACPSGANVCGVTLATAKPAGQTPVASEFNAEKADLWTSQQSGSPADGNIEMKN